MTSKIHTEELLTSIEQALSDMKAIDTISANVQGVVSFTDYIVVATGRSSRHVRALASNVIEAAQNIGCYPVGIEGYEHNEWILVDLGSVVVHLMQSTQREYYELEKLWLDAPTKSVK
ncbi:MAG: ribosome silencing factor [Candidatus Porifericomitaceae bacterium WSBS_2022_MAG_OTU9]